MIRILIGATKNGLTGRLEGLLSVGGIETESADGLDRLLEKLSRGDFDLLVVERPLLPESPAASLASLRELPEHPAVIVLTEDDLPKERAELLAAGALAVLWLGLDDGLLGETLLSLARRQSEDVLERLGAERHEKRSKLDDFASRSPAMHRFLKLARRVVRGDSALLILGETGVGKERLARSIHSESSRANGPFITVNCGALPEALLESELFGHEEGAFTGAVRARRGYFELAHRGTILLDEIGEMPPHLQVKLLRVLEDRNIHRVGGERPIDVDVRIMAATNRDLRREMEQKRFRTDLYYRLAVVTLTLPPLRERREDIPDLARAFLDRIRRQLGRPVTGFHPDAMEALLRHDWPGNVRELINVVERAVLLAPGKEITVSDFRGGESWTHDGGEATAFDAEAAPRPSIHSDRPLSEAREEILASFEKRYLRELLTRNGGRIGETARRAGITERTLYTMMRRYRLRKEDFKRRAAAPDGSR